MERMFKSKQQNKIIERMMMNCWKECWYSV